MASLYWGPGWGPGWAAAGMDITMPRDYYGNRRTRQGLHSRRSTSGARQRRLRAGGCARGGRNGLQHQLRQPQRATVRSAAARAAAVTTTGAAVTITAVTAITAGSRGDFSTAARGMTSTAVRAAVSYNDRGSSGSGSGAFQQRRFRRRLAAVTAAAASRAVAVRAHVCVSNYSIHHNWVIPGFFPYLNNWPAGLKNPTPPSLFQGIDWIVIG